MQAAYYFNEDYIYLYIKWLNKIMVAYKARHFQLNTDLIKTLWNDSLKTLCNNSYDNNYAVVVSLSHVTLL